MEKEYKQIKRTVSIWVSDTERRDHINKFIDSQQSEINRLKEDIKNKLSDYMYNITEESGTELFVVEWEDIEKVLNKH